MTSVQASRERLLATGLIDKCKALKRRIKGAPNMYYSFNNIFSRENHVIVFSKISKYFSHINF